jgi:hypothetical protein
MRNLDVKKKGWYYFSDLDVDARITFRWISGICGFNCVTMESSGGLFEHLGIA